MVPGHIPRGYRPEENLLQKLLHGYGVALFLHLDCSSQWGHRPRGYDHSTEILPWQSPHKSWPPAFHCQWAGLPPNEWPVHQTRCLFFVHHYFLVLCLNNLLLRGLSESGRFYNSYLSWQFLIKFKRINFKPIIFSSLNTKQRLFTPICSGKSNLIKLQN